MIVSPDQVRELRLCRRNLFHWAGAHVRVEDKEHGTWVPFRPYHGQKALLDLLLQGRWVLLGKARRLGATAAVLVAALHQITFFAPCRVVIVSQNRETAEQLLEWFDRLDRTQPAWMRRRRISQTKTSITYARGCVIEVKTSGVRAGRSLAVDFLIVDEADYVENLAGTLQAAEPTLETGKGLCVCMSTSSGPGTYWEAKYRAAVNEPQRSKYVPFFLSWRARPGRTQAWYDAEAAAHANEPGYMEHEYPGSWEEMFVSAGGAVYAGISRKTHFLHYDRPPAAQIYCGVDWGTSPLHPSEWVWLWNDPNSRPRLTFEPDCDVLEEDADVSGIFPSGTAELFAYRRDPKNGKLIKQHDHFPDALRYAVHGNRLGGHVHVMRVYVRRVGHFGGFDTLEFFQRVLELSGWQPMDDRRERWRATRGKTESFASIVSDPGGGGRAAAELAMRHTAAGDFNLPIALYPSSDNAEHSREAGITWLKSLAHGDHPQEIVEDFDRAEDLRRRYRAGESPVTIEEWAQWERMSIEEGDPATADW